MSRKGSFNLIHQQSGIKVDIMLDKETDFSASEFSRKKMVEVAPGVKVSIASPEDIILKKLDFYREGQSEKHLTDIREIIMGTKIDETYMEKWVAHLNLKREWEKVGN